MEAGAGSLADKRVLVVGASSGIGRATASAARRAGARVAFAARRASALADAIEAAGGPPDAAAVVGDVTAADGSATLVREAVGALGGLDALVYAAAVTHLEPVEDVDESTWHRLLATNAVGAALVLAAALPHLRAGWGRTVVITSDSVGHPFPGLAPYVASKAALESVVRSWRVEHPELDLCLLTAGPTATDAAAAWDPGALDRFFGRWIDEGYVRPDLVPADPADVGAQIVAILESDVLPAEVDLAPERPWAR